MTLNEKEKPEVVKKSAVVFTMFYVLGTLSHVPQSFYVTANDYWMYKFRNSSEVDYDSTDSSKTDLQAKFTSYYGAVSNISMVAGLVFTVFLFKKFSPKGIIVTTLSGFLGLLTLTIIFAWVDTDSWQTEFFIISLLIGSVLNFIGSCFLLSIFYLAMKFPAVYLGAVLSGQAICGILSTLIQILTLAVGTSSLVKATLYFVIGTLSVAVVQILFMKVLTKHPYYQDQVNKEQKREPLKLDRHTIFRITKKIWKLLLTMVFVAGMMIAMHPGVTSLVESTNKGHGNWGDVYFVPVCIFLAYNVFDFVGRECSFRIKVIKNQWALLTFAVLRLSFVPLLLFCNVQPRKNFQVLFGEDWEFLIVIIAFSITGGYALNLCIVTMPSVCEPEEMTIASVLIVLVMVASLAVCSVLGPLIISLV